MDESKLNLRPGMIMPLSEHQIGRLADGRVFDMDILEDDRRNAEKSHYIAMEKRKMEEQHLIYQTRQAIIALQQDVHAILLLLRDQEERPRG